MAASRKPVTISTPFLKLVLNGRPDMSANTTLLTSANLWWMASHLLPRFFFLLLPRRDPGFYRRFLLLGLLPRFGLQGRFRLLYLFQAAFPPRQFFRQLVAESLAFFLILGHVRGFCTLQQVFDLRLQLCFRFTHPAIAHRLMLAGVGLLLGPVQGDMSHLH